MYEVTGTSILCTGDNAEILVHYKSLEDQHCWSRTKEDFVENVADNSGTIVPRFKLVEPLDSVEDLLVETVLLHKQIWDKCKEENPGFLSNGSGKSLQYLVGDKISFALSTRLITRAKAEELLKQVNDWS